ncbi:MAG: hypothetical protein LBQ68_06315 [Clostridiales bacterium]|jgi:hypothetical protein|nr:hypothetical protein [Clostridiales bacterium]
MKTMIYTGTIRESLLKQMLTVLSECSRQTNFVLHLYSPNCGVVDDMPWISKFGQVSHNHSLKAQEGGDILLSMGVSGTRFIAAKIFEYISTGKKIIHFYVDDYDPNVPYYSNISNALCVDIKKDVHQNIAAVVKFIQNDYEPLSFEEISKLFPMNEAKYTYNTIMERVSI